MLNQMRALSQSWVGRSIMAVVLGFIILSFAIWGIGDRFTNFNADQLAQVGGTAITVDDYRQAYQDQLQRLQQQQKRGITNAEARALGLDRQVLSRLLRDAVLSSEAAKLGVVVGDRDVGKAIVADRLFKGEDGQFDANRFHELLRVNGLSEASYVREQRSTMQREDVADAVIGGLDLPAAMTSAIDRFRSEVRDATYFVLPPPAPASIPEPGDKELQSYYDRRPEAYTAPEYRKLTVLSIVPVDLVKAAAVSDEDVAKLYEETKAARFTTPEKRTLQQLVFVDTRAADAAKAKLVGGESFDALAADEKKSATDITLGTMTREEVGAKAVADAAFALHDGGTSAPVPSQFGPVLVHVSSIVPGRQQPLGEVAAQLRDELAVTRAKTEVTRLRDRIEDARGAGKTLAEAAAAVGLHARTIEAIDAKGYGRDGKPIEALVDGPAVLKAAFATDAGADTEVIPTTDGGDVWYEVAAVDPSRRLPLADVKGQVEADWRADETARRLAASADAIVAAIDGGKSVADQAAANGGAPVMVARDVGRTGGPALPRQTTAAFFDVPVGKAGSSAEPNGGRAIFKVDAARVPPPDLADATAAKMIAQVKVGLLDDVIAQYLSAVQSEVGVKVNQQALQSALGGDDSGS